MAEGSLKIGDVAERTGLSIRTLRHYDELGVVTPSDRSPGGFRLYSDADVHRILLIRRMKPLGFTLEQMREFLEATDILHGRDNRQGSGPPPQDRDQAEATITSVRSEARSRYETLRKQLDHAREFLDLINNLEP